MNWWRFAELVTLMAGGYVVGTVEGGPALLPIYCGVAVLFALMDRRAA